MDQLFALRVHLEANHTAWIRVYDTGLDSRGKQCYRATVKMNGKEIFPIDGPIWGVFGMGVDPIGNEAKCYVLEHVGMKPGDLDRDFFHTYQPDQLDFVNKYGERLTGEAGWRYGIG